MGTQGVPLWVEEARKYNGARITRYKEFEYVMNVMALAGFKCIDVGGPSPDFADDVVIEKNEGLQFTYIRYKGPNSTVYNYICLQPGQIAVIQSKGYEYRGDDLGCHDEWNEKIQFTNDGNQIISQRIEGGHHIECPGAAHRLERARISDVRDLYYL